MKWLILIITFNLFASFDDEFRDDIERKTRIVKLRFKESERLKPIVDNLNTMRADFENIYRVRTKDFIRCYELITKNKIAHKEHLTKKVLMNVAIYKDHFVRAKNGSTDFMRVSKYFKAVVNSPMMQMSDEQKKYARVNLIRLFYNQFSKAEFEYLKSVFRDIPEIKDYYHRHFEVERLAVWE